MEDPFPLAVPHVLQFLSTPFATALNLATLPSHVHEILLSVVTYHLLFTYVSPFLSRRLFPRIYPSLQRTVAINWDAHAAALVQCLITNTFLLWVMTHDPLRTEPQTPFSRLFAYSPAIGAVQGHMAGYFIWDIIVSVRHFKVLGVASLVHAVSALSITILGFRPFANYYGLSFAAWELSNVNMNLHWFFDKSGLTGSRVQWINGIMLISSFGLVRLLYGNYQSAWMFYDIWQTLGRPTGWQIVTGHADNTWLKGNIPEWVPGVRPGLPLGLAYAYVVGSLALSVLNANWFRIMILILRKRMREAQRPKGSRSDKVGKKVQ